MEAWLAGKGGLSRPPSVILSAVKDLSLELYARSCKYAFGQSVILSAAKDLCSAQREILRCTQSPPFVE